MSDPIHAAAARIALGIGAAAAPGTRPVGGAGAADPSGFAENLKKFVNDVSGQKEQASDILASYLRGDPVELHQVMAAQEEAGIAVELLVETRNKVLDAYRQLTNIQV